MNQSEACLGVVNQFARVCKQFFKAKFQAIFSELMYISELAIDSEERKIKSFSKIQSVEYYQC